MIRRPDSFELHLAELRGLPLPEEPEKAPLSTRLMLTVRRLWGKVVSFTT